MGAGNELVQQQMVLNPQAPPPNNFDVFHFPLFSLFSIFFSLYINLKHTLRHAYTHTHTTSPAPGCRVNQAEIIHTYTYTIYTNYWVAHGEAKGEDCLLDRVIQRTEFYTVCFAKYKLSLSNICITGCNKTMHTIAYLILLFVPYEDITHKLLTNILKDLNSNYCVAKLRMSDLEKMSPLLLLVVTFVIK